MAERNTPGLKCGRRLLAAIVSEDELVEVNPELSSAHSVIGCRSAIAGGCQGHDQRVVRPILHLGGVQRRGFSVPLIAVSGTIGADAAVDLMKGGATDYCLQDRLYRAWSRVA